MTKTGLHPNTFSSLPSGEWLPAENLPKQLAATNTTGLSNEGVVIMKGRVLVHDETARVEVTVDPSAIDRKLAIRKLNDQIEGRSPLSDTFTDVSTRR